MRLTHWCQGEPVLLGPCSGDELVLTNFAIATLILSVLQRTSNSRPVDRHPVATVHPCSGARDRYWYGALVGAWINRKKPIG